MSDIQERESGQERVKNSGTLVLFMCPLALPPGLKLVKSIVLLLLVIGTLAGVAAGLPSWIWMMPPVMAQMVVTQISKRIEFLFLLDFLDFMFLGEFGVIINGSRNCFGLVIFQVGLFVP